MSLISRHDLVSDKSSDLLEIIDILVSDLIINFNESHSSRKTRLGSMFYLIKAKPSISLLDYLRRIKKFTNCNNEIFLLAFIYFDRVIKKEKITSNKLNIHKLFFLSIIMAFKYYDDKVYTNVFFSKVGGIRTEDLYLLEIEFLEMIDYNLYVSKNSFRKLTQNLCQLFNINHL